MTTKKCTYSVVVETENLGMAGYDDLANSLESIKSQTYGVGNLEEVLLIVGGHVSEVVINKLKQEFPFVTMHIEKEEMDYARSKMKAVEVARGDVVVFADSDMRYERKWLANMIETHENAKPKTIVSGDTRLETNSAYAFALNCTWMIQILSDKTKIPVPTAFFPLNNFAIAKADLKQMPIPFELPLYRNKIPLWEAQLLQNGFEIVRAPGSRGHHAPPGNVGDWFWRMLIYGADFVAQADFSVTASGEIEERRNLSGRMYKLCLLVPWKIEQLFLNSYKLIKEDWRRLRYLPGAIVIGLVNCIVVALGALVACVSRDFVFRRINAREEIHIV